MLSPKYEIIQSSKRLYITIHAPCKSTRNSRLYVKGNDFRFSSLPYYVRFQLPGEILKNEKSDGAYNKLTGDYILMFLKKNKGEYFEGLNAVENLFVDNDPKSANKRLKYIAPKIEVLKNPRVNADWVYNVYDDGEWSPDEDLTKVEGKKLIQCGFANKTPFPIHCFNHFRAYRITDLISPFVNPFLNYRKRREKIENAQFDYYYWNDLLDKDLDQKILSYSPAWEALTESNVLSDLDKKILNELPNKEYSLTDDEVKGLLLGIIDILYAICYNERVTLGKNEVDSAWTINKLSATLSWFEFFTDIQQVVVVGMKRSLCFPKIKSWVLAIRVFEDMKRIIKSGRKFIIKQFCELYTMFNNRFEPRSALNDLYIKDYLIWLQQIPDSTIEELYNSIADMLPNSKDLGLDVLTAIHPYFPEENRSVPDFPHNFPTKEEHVVLDSNPISDLGDDLNNLSLSNSMRVVDSFSISYYDNELDMTMEESKDDD